MSKSYNKNGFDELIKILIDQAGKNFYGLTLTCNLQACVHFLDAILDLGSTLNTFPDQFWLKTRV